MFEITPYVGASLIKFGMKREEVRKVFLSMSLEHFSEILIQSLLLMAMMKLVLIYIMIVLIKL